MLPLSLAPAVELSAVEVHSLPCEIDFEGPANVDTYFVPNDQESEQVGNLVANLRGRRLVGRRYVLPERCVGLYCKQDWDFDQEQDEDDKDDEEEEEEAMDGQGKRILQVQSRFEAITHWNQDQIPRPNQDETPVWLEFVRFSRVLHGIES